MGATAEKTAVAAIATAAAAAAHLDELMRRGLIQCVNGIMSPARPRDDIGPVPTRTGCRTVMSWTSLGGETAERRHRLGQRMEIGALERDKTLRIGEMQASGSI